MDERTRRMWSTMEKEWEHPDDVPFPEGAEIDLDAVGREDMEEDDERRNA